MSTEEALLAAILADPAADEPRRVYADLLLARGDLVGTWINASMLDVLRRRLGAGLRRTKLKASGAGTRR